MRKKIKTPILSGDPTSNERAIALSSNQKISEKISEKNFPKKRIGSDIEKNLPDPLLYHRHRELLNKRITEVVVVAHGIGREVRIVDLGIDVQAVSKGLELAYRIKHKMSDVDPSANKELPTPILQQFIQNIQINSNSKEK